ncbi:hypothetical protein STRDD11_00033 [Streptococcus sp. DD11]|nr:hypothetical protein STRDD11_00033 [Streptococcus sp. DD11]
MLDTFYYITNSESQEKSCNPTNADCLKKQKEQASRLPQTASLLSFISLS